MDRRSRSRVERLWVSLRALDRVFPSKVPWPLFLRTAFDSPEELQLESQVYDICRKHSGRRLELPVYTLATTHFMEVHWTADLQCIKYFLPPILRAVAADKLCKPYEFFSGTGGFLADPHAGYFGRRVPLMNLLNEQQSRALTEVMANWLAAELSAPEGGPLEVCGIGHRLGIPGDILREVWLTDLEPEAEAHLLEAIERTQDTEQALLRHHDVLTELARRFFEAGSDRLRLQRLSEAEAFLASVIAPDTACV